MHSLRDPQSKASLLKFDTTPKTIGMNGKQLRVLLPLFPVAPWFASTTIKLQGTTLDMLIKYVVREGVITQKPVLYVLSRNKKLQMPILNAQN